ncbi:MAG: alpha/beta hydrolase-fold protein [Micropruina sp.]
MTTGVDRVLAATPLADHGGALPARPAWLDEVRTPEDARAWWQRAEATPITGERMVRDGVAMVEVSFCAWSDDDEVMLHLASLTDAHRTDIGPALLQPVAGSGLRVLSCLLPADGRYSYRLLRRRRIARDVGRDRAGWLGVHLDGRADPRNPLLLDDAVDRPPSSLWLGPDVPAWPAPTPPTVWQEGVAGGRGFAWQPASDPVATLMLFDGEAWRRLDPRRLPGLDRVTLVLIDSGSREQRASDLLRPDRAAALVASVREKLLGLAPELAPTLGADRLIVAGQSFGGLAAAGVVATAPTIARRAVAQSGSFWYQQANERYDEAGDLVQRLRAERTKWPGRLVVQVGTEEPDMLQRAVEFSAAARSAGHRVDYREYRGGHDYAWWYPALADGVAELLAPHPALA